MILLIDKHYLNSFMNYEMEMIFKMYSYFSENTVSLNKLYNLPTRFIIILLMNYLLITLIVDVSMTNMNKGPLCFMN